MNRRIPHKAGQAKEYRIKKGWVQAGNITVISQLLRLWSALVPPTGCLKHVLFHEGCLPCACLLPICSLSYIGWERIGNR